MTSIYVSNLGALPKRREFDFYPTERALIRAILKHRFDRVFMTQVTNKAPLITVLDPGAGDGRWGELARIYFEQFFDKVVIVGVELREVPAHPAYDEWITCDYTLWRDDRKFDIILGNPPFGLAEEFIRLSYNRVKIYAWMILLLPLDFVCGEDRYENFYRDMPLMCVDAIARRPSFTQDGGTGATQYGVFMWRPHMVLGYGNPYTLSMEMMTYERSDEDLVPEKVELRRQAQREKRQRKKLESARKKVREATEDDVNLSVPA